MAPADKPPPLTTSRLIQPDPQQPLLQGFLLAQIVFNSVLLILPLLTGNVETIVGVCSCGSVFLLLPGAYSLQLYFELYKLPEKRQRRFRYFGFPLYGVQTLVFGLIVLAVVGNNLSQVFDVAMFIIGFIGIGVALGSLVALALYHRANPFERKPPKPAAPAPEPEDIETNGDWDEAADRGRSRGR